MTGMTLYFQKLFENITSFLLLFDWFYGIMEICMGCMGIGKLRK